MRQLRICFRAQGHYSSRAMDRLKVSRPQVCIYASLVYVQ
jgi:hypothetical protein